jgi:hypothetical protein
MKSNTPTGAFRRAPILALLNFDFGGAADADHRDAARRLRQPLRELLASSLSVVDGRGRPEAAAAQL